MKKRIKWFLSIIIVFVLVISGISVGTQKNVFADAVTENEFNNYTREDSNDESEIELDSVVVTLTETASKRCDIYTSNDFKEIECVEVEDSAQFMAENNKRVLNIRLKETGKDNVFDAIEKLQKREDVLIAGPNYIYSLADITNYTTNYSYYQDGKQWGLSEENGIQIENAWRISSGSGDLRVGVIDTGIDGKNPDLKGYLKKGNLHVDCTGVGREHLNEDKVFDLHGHGTHVAGIICAQGRVSGVCKKISLISIRVFDENLEAKTYALMDAINYAKSINIPILNYSIGGLKKDSNVKEALKDYNGVFICAAGNGGVDEIGDNNDTTPHYPSNHSYGESFSDHVISVGAIDEQGNCTVFSNYGANSVSLFAPGNNILSTYPVERCTGRMKNTKDGEFLECECKVLNPKQNSNLWEWGWNGSTHVENGYHYMSGTSMATPYVTGVVALMMSVNPNLSAAEVKSALLNNVDIPDIEGSNPLKGRCVSNGRLNAYRAVSSVAFQTNGDSITGLNSSAAKDVRYISIPKVFKGQEINSIGDYAFANRTSLTKVDLPASMNIAENTFYGCVNLEKITSGSNTSHNTGNLGTSFTDWKILERLPYMDYSNLYEMGQKQLSVKYTAYFDVFGTVEYELALTNDNVSNQTIYSSFSFKPGDGKDHTRELTFNPIELENIPKSTQLCIQIRYRKTNWAWGGDFSVTGKKTEMELIRKENVTTHEGLIIEGSTVTAYFAPFDFKGSVIIPEGVTAIGENVFDSCDDLRRIELPLSLISIGNHAFNDCSNLESITIPKGIKNIGAGAFYGCNQLSSIYYNAIDCSDIQSGKELFNDDASVFTVYIGYGVKKIPARLFSGISQIEKISLPNTVEIIGEKAFKYCENLKEVNIGRNSRLQKIGAGAFSGTKIQEIVIPTTVTNIGDEAFRGCDEMTATYYLGKDERSWGRISVGNFNEELCSVICYYSAEKPTVSGNYWGYKDGEITLWRQVTFNPDNGQALKKDFVWDSETIVKPQDPQKEAAIFMFWAYADDLSQEYNWDASVVQDLELKAVWITKFSFERLGSGYEISKGEAELNGVLRIPATYKGIAVTSIAESGFKNCSGLTDLEIPSSIKNIGTEAFAACENLRKVGIVRNSELCKIGSGAFSNCGSLVSVIIPESVEEIGTEAFLGCDGLETIYYGGSDEQSWNSIIMDEAEKEALREKVYYYYNQGDVQPEGTYWYYVGNSSVETIEREIPVFGDAALKIGFMNPNGTGAFIPDILYKTTANWRDDSSYFLREALYPALAHRKIEGYGCEINWNMVKSIQVSAAWDMITIELYDDLSFSDGNYITAWDFKAYYELRKQISSDYVDGYINSMEVSEETILEINLTKRVDVYWLLSEMRALPSAVAEAYAGETLAELNGKCLSGGYSASGKYYIESYSDGHVKLHINEWKKAPIMSNIESIEIHWYSDKAEAYADYRAGNIDICYNAVPEEEYPDLWDSEDFHVYDSKIRMYMGIGKNSALMTNYEESQRNTLLQALGYAIDYERIYNEGFGLGEWLERNGWFPDGLPDYSNGVIGDSMSYPWINSKYENSWLQRVGYASALLQAAGLDQEFSQGLTMCLPDKEKFRLLGEILELNFDALGIEIEVYHSDSEEDRQNADICFSFYNFSDGFIVVEETLIEDLAEWLNIPVEEIEGTEAYELAIRFKDSEDPEEKFLIFQALHDLLAAQGVKIGYFNGCYLLSRDFEQLQPNVLGMIAY